MTFNNDETMFGTEYLQDNIESTSYSLLMDNHGHDEVN